jgi:hypothetical protein
VNDVPDVEQTDSGDAVEWRHQRRVAQLSFGAFDGGFVDFDLRIEFVDRGLLVVAQLARSGIFFDEFTIALEVQLPVAEVGLVMGERGFILIELRLIGA